MLAELLTITWVTGNPPINPETMFPIPWALNSWLVGVILFCGATLSEASTHGTVFIYAHMPCSASVSTNHGFSIRITHICST